MKNKLESFTILLIGILSVIIVFLIVQYNIIEEESIDEIAFVLDADKKEKQKLNTGEYLNSLEGYGDDLDVKVDVSKEDHTNEVKIKSELSKDALDDIVEDKSKIAYMENLEHYIEETDKASPKTIAIKQNKKEKIPKISSSNKHKQLEKEEVKNEIVEAIDAILGGM